jgi:hypothetical protein
VDSTDEKRAVVTHEPLTAVLNPTIEIQVDEYGDPAYIVWEDRNGYRHRVRLFGGSPGAC